MHTRMHDMRSSMPKKVWMLWNLLAHQRYCGCAFENCVQLPVAFAPVPA
jgi:hypothetical protein